MSERKESQLQLDILIALHNETCGLTGAELTEVLNFPGRPELLNALAGLEKAKLVERSWHNMTNRLHTNWRLSFPAGATAAQLLFARLTREAT